MGTPIQSLPLPVIEAALGVQWECQYGCRLAFAQHAHHALAIVCTSLRYQPSQAQGLVDKSMKLPPFLSMLPGISSDIPQHFFPRTTSRNGKWVLEWDMGEGEGRSMIMSHSRIARITLALRHSSLVGPDSTMQDVLARDEAVLGPRLGSIIGLSWVDLLVCQIFLNLNVHY